MGRRHVQILILMSRVLDVSAILSVTKAKGLVTYHWWDVVMLRVVGYKAGKERKKEIPRTKKPSLRGRGNQEFFAYLS